MDVDCIWSVWYVFVPWGKHIAVWWWFLLSEQWVSEFWCNSVSVLSVRRTKSLEVVFSAHAFEQESLLSAWLVFQYCLNGGKPSLCSLQQWHQHMEEVEQKVRTLRFDIQKTIIKPVYITCVDEGRCLMNDYCLLLH